MSEPTQNDRLTAMVDRLKAGEYRMTPQRRAVLKVLAESRRHPTAEEIHEVVRADFPMTSLATIYKTVTLLKELGEIVELRVAGRCRYDGRNPAPHSHLFCVGCERVVDAEVKTVHAVTEGLARRTGYRIIGQRIDFLGVCPECQ